MWKMQSAFPIKLAVLGEAVRHFEARIEAMSGGALQIKAGSIDARWGASAYHVGKIPALSWFTALPFGPRAGEYLAWLRSGGGGEIYHEIYQEHGVKGLHCLVIDRRPKGPASNSGRQRHGNFDTGIPGEGCNMSTP